MPSFGKIYSFQGNSRTIAIRAVAKANKIDLEDVNEEPAKGVSAEYLKINPLGTVPTFVGADGFKLSESIAIAVYITSQNEKTALLGKTKQDYASILQWMSLANFEILPHITGWLRPLTGRDPYNKKNVEEHAKATNEAINIIEKHLVSNTFLVGERLSLADIYVAGNVTRGFEKVITLPGVLGKSINWLLQFFDKKWRQEHPNFSRWYETVHNQPIYSDVQGKPTFIDEAIKNQAPKRDQVSKKDTAVKAAKPKAKEPENDEEEEEAKPAPKPKHPLESLEKPTLVLDDWKRTYSNEETREVALPWFWKNYKPEEYSLWRLDYQYNEELTQVFMTANLIGGFFTRLEASRKYIFGAASVYGQSNDSVVVGAFVIRGDNAEHAFDVAPDSESYKFTKLDHNNKQDQEFVNDQWAWDKPVTVNGKEYPWADGKVFK
ncbi:MAG: hypothetical protein M1825_000014 [Sarcosagium campestre]|nr:MAG: hypothetical protein M1825_000014 [Sarcosagium campestre]